MVLTYPPKLTRLLHEQVSHHKLEGRGNDLALDQHLMMADMEVGERTWHINGGCGGMMRRMTDQGKIVSA